MSMLMGQKIQEFSESATSTFTRAKLQFTSILTDLYSGRTHRGGGGGGGVKVHLGPSVNPKS